MRPSRAAALLAPLLLAACHGKVVRVDMDAARLAAPPTSARNAVRLACPYQLQEVTDARTGGGESGGLGWHAFKFSDAAQAIRSQLLASGLSDAGNDTGDAPAVNVRIAQLYLAQNLTTKIPVAVYKVDVGGAPEFVVRSQSASMNWNGTQNEAYAAFARVLADVNQQLVHELNDRCNGRS
ncbi:hypothetical protein [Lysobacter tyrosinilyticus]